MKHYDVVVIGAGPAGSHASYLLAKSGMETLLIDKGPDVAERKCPGGRFCESCPSCYVVSGFGGAGLFSDGKLVDVDGLINRPTDSSTGNKGKHYFEQLVGEYAKVYLIRVMDRILSLLPPTEVIAPTALNISHWKKRAQKFSVDIDFASSIHIGSSGLKDLVKRIKRDLTETGCKINLNSFCQEIDQYKKGWKIKVKDKQDNSYWVSAKHALIAVGKSGSDWLSRQMSRLKISDNSNFCDIGIRVVMPAKESKVYKQCGLDPKFRWTSPSGINFRTFCFCDGGTIVPYRWNGCLLAGGQSESMSKGPYTNFAILGRVTNKNMNSIKLSKDLLNKWKTLSSHSILYQRLDGFINRLNTQSYKDPKIRFGMNQEVFPLLPDKVYLGIKEFLINLMQIAEPLSHIPDEEVTICGPACEWSVPKPKLNKYQEVAGSNGLYLLGDVGGCSQGIIGAMISAESAVDGIRNSFKSK